MQAEKWRYDFKAQGSLRRNTTFKIALQSLLLLLLRVIQLANSKGEFVCWWQRKEGGGAETHAHADPPSCRSSPPVAASGAIASHPQCEMIRWKRQLPVLCSHLRLGGGAAPQATLASAAKGAIQSWAYERLLNRAVFTALGAPGQAQRWPCHSDVEGERSAWLVTELA